MPRPLAIPAKATPSVDITPQEVPISMPMREHIRKVIIRKNLASIIFRPM